MQNLELDLPTEQGFVEVMAATITAVVTALVWVCK